MHLLCHLQRMVGNSCKHVLSVVQPCKLYSNKKSPKQQLFVAAAALYYLTGDGKYRTDADKWHDPNAFTFYNNWNNVATQGLAILAGAPDAPGALRSRTHYMGQLRAAVKFYSDCSNDGQAGKCCK